MKPTQLYQHLQETAEKLGIRVSEQNLRTTGVNARSGLCRVKGESIFIMDKNLPVRQKTEILADCLRQMPLEDVYLVPAVRNYLEKEPGVGWSSS
jgi:hypothetical protein